MKTRFPIVALGELISRVSRPEKPVSGKSYRQAGVRLWGKGAYEREPLDGGATKYQALYRLEDRDFVINKIWARNGAAAVITENLAGTFVSGEFPTFRLKENRLLPEWMDAFTRHHWFWHQCGEQSKGTSGKNRIRPERLRLVEIPLPDSEEQRRLTAVMRSAATRAAETVVLLSEIGDEQDELLYSIVMEITQGVPRLPMKEVAPIIRRKVEIQKNAEYPELGIRSFGKGTFHKPAIKGSDLGSKRLYRIEPGDLLFSNVFAWEGAIAIAQQEDKNRYGSHRFITCLPDPSKALVEYLRMWFLSAEGMAEIRAASPGAAGRNKTLNLKKLEAIQVPIPDMPKQRRFAAVYARVQAARKLNQQTTDELEAIMPAALEQAFQGVL
jgi:type I restriction enzyme S subunit